MYITTDNRRKGFISCNCDFRHEFLISSKQKLSEKVDINESFISLSVSFFIEIYRCFSIYSNFFTSHFDFIKSLKHFSSNFMMRLVVEFLFKYLKILRTSLKLRSECPKRFLYFGIQSQMETKAKIKHVKNTREKNWSITLPSESVKWYKILSYSCRSISTLHVYNIFVNNILGAC